MQKVERDGWGVMGGFESVKIREILEVDIVDKETQSRMMAAVKGQNTRYEIAIRKRLFSRGFRYRIDNRKLPGRPDIDL
jgi:DNA mismatch endonuclease (patch repair protein)